MQECQENLPMMAAVSVEMATQTADDDEEGLPGNLVTKEFRTQLKIDIESESASNARKVAMELNLFIFFWVF